MRVDGSDDRPDLRVVRQIEPRLVVSELLALRFLYMWSRDAGLDPGTVGADSYLLDYLEALGEPSTVMLDQERVKWLKRLLGAAADTGWVLPTPDVKGISEGVPERARPVLPSGWTLILRESA